MGTKTSRLSGLLLVAAFVLLSCQKNWSPEKNHPYISRLSYIDFVDPPNEFRSHTFYSINDSLTKEAITSQIKGFKKAGLGGFYLHSRNGLITEFLGDDWWEIMQAAVSAASEAGLRCMFYDEDKWPSGFAGGIIPEMDVNYRAKCLARLDKSTKLPPGSEKIGEDSLTQYILYTSQFGYDIFNGTCYVDLFNPEAVKAFLDTSYKPYVDKYRHQIQNYTPAIFSDEPHVHARYFDRSTPNLGTLSYSPWLEKKFRELYGYELRDKLELLYEEKDNWREVRMQYYRAKALLFEESFTKQLADFCEQNDMDYTGHYLAEEVYEKIRDRAANTMLHYRKMQQPGMDNLGLGFEEKLITSRNLSSVANQYRKEKRLSELFGISGQNMNFEDRKWIAGWHAINGVNHFCPHLTLYSMKGLRKRDYPPTFSYQQAYWEYNKKLEDYLGRIAMAASIGEYNPQILVVSPLESEYIKSKNDGEFTSGMVRLLQVLEEGHYEYDTGDEQILEDTATVINGRLVVGAMSYAHLILPDMISIRQSTIDLILALKKQGGTIASTGRFPLFVDGKENEDALSQLRKEVVFLKESDWGNQLQNIIEPAVRISGDKAGQVWSQSRSVKGGKLIQLFNVSHTEDVSFELNADFTGGNMVLWDPSTIQCYRIKTEANGNYKLSMRPSSSIWITSGSLSADAKIDGNYALPKTRKDLIVLDKPWTGKRLTPNALTLDFASYSTDGKTFSEAEPVIGIFNRLSDQSYSGPLFLSFEFEAAQIPTSCSLVLEQPDLFDKIIINGTPYNFTDNGYFVDQYFRKSNISTLVKQGKNKIEFFVPFKAPEPLSRDPKSRYGTEIESIYLIGDFAVEARLDRLKYDTQRNESGDFQRRPVYENLSFQLTNEQTAFEGELSQNGYPFFSGKFELSQDFYLDEVQPNKQYFLDLPNCESIATLIQINNQTIDTLVWAPFQTELTPYLIKGKNTLKITLVNSLRNLLGPHHHKDGELTKVGPNSFTGLGGFPDGRGERNWYDTRKVNNKNPIWTDHYMNIPFGFLEPPKISIQSK